MFRLSLCGISVDDLAALGQTEITVGFVLHLNKVQPMNI